MTLVILDSLYSRCILLTAEFFIFQLTEVFSTIFTNFELIKYRIT